MFFLTALLLLEIAARRRPTWPYILGALALVFAAGEEISWGQRIFLFETPDYLREINLQDEFNLHNIEGLQDTIFWIYRVVIMLLCIVTSAAYFSRKSSFFGVPFPSILTMYCFLSAFAFRYKDFSEWIPPTIVYGEGRLLLLLFVAYGLFSRKIHLFVLSVLFFSAGVLEQSILHEIALRPFREVQEYLVSIACLVYAVEILAHRRPQGDKKEVVSLLGRPGRFTLVLAVALAMLGSCLVYAFNYITTARILSQATAGEPVARDFFDIYLGEGSLTYAKDPCARADTEATFFLNLIPADVDDLPEERKQYGFDNLDFAFTGYGFIGGGVCVARRELPDYAIATIRTGQYIGEGKNIWEVSFDVVEPAGDGQAVP